MTLQSSGPIDFGQINVELGLPVNTQISLNDGITRCLSGLLSGTVGMNSFYNKSMTAIAANPTIMASIAANPTAMNAVIASPTACAAIKASPTAITALDNSSPIHIPTMTSDTTPSGVASADSVHQGTYLAYLAMNKNIIPDSGWGNSKTYGWIQYKFTTPVWCYKMTLYNNWSAVPTLIIPKNIIIQYSNDGVTFSNALTTINPQILGLQTFIISAPNSKALYWRLNILDNWGCPSNTAVLELDFFCK